MQSHIPDGGSAIIVYGPHVGIDADGRFGAIDRRGHRDETPCCGSAVAAANHVMNLQARSGRSQSTRRTHTAATAAKLDFLDLEQSRVNSLLLAYKDRLADSLNPMVELPLIMFDIQRSMFDQIMEAAAPKQPVAFLGGIQINTPNGEADYFCPLAFSLANHPGRKAETNLVDKLYMRS
jgi:hypothetical protein